MKTLLCLLALALPLSAATETGTVTVPNAQVAGLATVVESWIQAQKKPDGSLKYPGATKADRRQSLLDSILRDSVRHVIRQACSQFPADCPVAIKDKIDAKSEADSAITTEVETIVQ